MNNKKYLIAIFLMFSSIANAQNYKINIVLDNNSNKYTNSIKNEDPKFVNYFTQKLNLRVKDDSPAKEKGNQAVAAMFPLDIVKISRTSSPTIGAYQ